MATLSLCIRESQKNADGSFTIKVAIGAKSRTTYIATRYRIDSIKQWKDGKVIRRPDADIMNRKLRGLLIEYENILESMPNNNVGAIEIRRYLEAKYKRSNSLKDYAEEYIERLKKENRASYAQNMGYTLKYLLECFGETVTLEQFSPVALNIFERYLREKGSRQTPKKDTVKKPGCPKAPKPISDTSVNIRMTHLKAILNAAVAEGIVEYKVSPFQGYKMPSKNVRETWISKEELKRIRNAEFSGIGARRHTIARDLFMLSFYFAGINLTDLIDARLDGDTITFVRKKTAAKKQGEKDVSLTIQPEARAIIDKYIDKDGALDFGYNFSDYGQFRSFITKGLRKIGENLGIEKNLMFYSARKTFVQFGQQLGIPIYVLEYSIGQTIKEANKRPIFDYLRVMRFQADLAIRAVIDYILDETAEDAMPIPDWARKK